MKGYQENLHGHANLAFLDCFPKDESLRSYAVKGLSKHPKEIASKFLYDQRGSELFDQICQQPEYYQTDSELEILGEYANAIVGIDSEPLLLFELGSGHSRKVRHLLEHLPPGSHFVSIDISGDYLVEHAKRLALTYPHIGVTAICADFLQEIPLPPALQAFERRMAFFPGSTIGNFEPHTQVAILRNVHKLLSKGGRLVIGVDRKNPAPVLEAAYNDKAGITAAFEMNLLSRMNRELGTDFDPNGFHYRGYYNPEKGRVEMYLVSEREQVVQFDGQRFHFAAGERLHVENSYKYEPEEFATQVAKAGFTLARTLRDSGKRFHVYLLDAT